MTPAPETVLPFDIEGVQLTGVLHEARGTSDCGVVIVVGGPQYRVGSHRQFVLLARALAEAGIPVLRFDYRGIGDSEGEPRDFETIDDDIRTAVDAFVETATVSRVVLWGLCDAAAAALMYAHSDPRIAGLVLLNPWVHSPATEAQVRFRTYYLGRLTSRVFWLRIARLDIDIVDSVRSLFGYFRDILNPGVSRPGSPLHFIERMREGWTRFTGPALLILSGDDLTAGEFRQLTRESDAWRSLVTDKVTQTLVLEEANHTFARAEWRRSVEQATVDWIRRL